MTKAFKESEIGIERPSGTEAVDWWVCQWIDSAFPTGGFAHSGGVEAAWQHGAIRNRAEWMGYLTASLDQAGHAALPWVTAAHAEPGRVHELDAWFDAFTTNHVANRASRLQGPGRRQKAVGGQGRGGRNRRRRRNP